MYWWLWLVLGLVLLGLEIFTPGGFYVLFFGIGALVVGTLVGLGAGGPVWFQWLLFSALSVVSLLIFRPHLIRATRSQERRDPMDTL
jgi:membrane protein implicated in regulation of membrane protease activity